MQILLSRTQAEPGRAVKVTANNKLLPTTYQLFYGNSVYKIVWPCIGGKVLIFSQNRAAAPSGQGGHTVFNPRSSAALQRQCRSLIIKISELRFKIVEARSGSATLSLIRLDTLRSDPPPSI